MRDATAVRPMFITVHVLCPNGCHIDVGGGAVPNGTEHKLSNITIRWMVQEIIASQCGILFDQEFLSYNGLTGAAPTKFFASPEGIKVEPKLEATDAVQPLHDQLVLDKMWWILEIMPLVYTWQDVEGCWHKQIRFGMLRDSFGHELTRKIRMNMGRGRLITDDRHPKFHVTVKQRMTDKSLNYQPKAIWEKGTEVYVE